MFEITLDIIPGIMFGSVVENVNEFNFEFPRLNGELIFDNMCQVTIEIVVDIICVCMCEIM